MGVSVIQELHDIILDRIKAITRGDWKIVVLDGHTQELIDNVVKEDEILNQNIANIERIEEKRDMNPDMDAIYILQPKNVSVECLIADCERRRYRKAYLIWTGLLSPQQSQKLNQHPAVQRSKAASQTLVIDFFPRESHLVTFRDPWSFPMLYNPVCEPLVKDHVFTLAKKIAGVCILLGEYPKIRFHSPRAPGQAYLSHELWGWLAQRVQEELDDYASSNPNFPAPSSRPQGVLLVTDRSMDLMAPLVHEFTYQAMSHDLLGINLVHRDQIRKDSFIKEDKKVQFHTTIADEEKDLDIHEKDTVWVDNRHRHMKDTIDKLMADFRKFRAQNPHFADDAQDSTSLNAIRDMLAGLPQFQEQKEAYSLHIGMAQECMNLFEQQKLPDVASVEQTMATGLDEDFRKPKNVLEQVVQLLDDDQVTKTDRLRLILIYAIYRHGMIEDDIHRLLEHAKLGGRDMKFHTEIIRNLQRIGARPIMDNLKDGQAPPPPLFPIDRKAAIPDEENYLSRFEPAVKHMLDELCRGTLDQATFPYVKPPLDPNEDVMPQGSLRAAKPSWAGAGRRRVNENRQRIVVFVAGGAAYSEARACYEIGAKHDRDVVLVSTHMVAPSFFALQVGDLAKDRRALQLPADRPEPRPPAHLFERPAPSPPQQPPPQQQMGMRPPAPVGMGGPGPGPAPRPPGAAGLPNRPAAPPTAAMGALSVGGASRPESRNEELNGSVKPGKLEKEKKKRNIFGLKKHHGGS